MAAARIIIGIDPAPKKRTVACIGGVDFCSIEARDLPSWVSTTLAQHERILLAWDAPLTFDPANGYSDRPVDSRLRAFIKSRTDRIAPKAVAVQPFSGCPHWTISCAALGMPFGHAPAGLRIAAAPDDGSKLVVEVHPAVSLALWWLHRVQDELMPKYKGSSRSETTAALTKIRSRLSDLNIPAQACVDDDHLDAWVAWKMGAGFISGEATWVGSAAAGGYVVPRIEAMAIPAGAAGARRRPAPG